MWLHVSMYILWNEIDNLAICCCLLNMSIFSLLFTNKIWFFAICMKNKTQKKYRLETRSDVPNGEE